MQKLIPICTLILACCGAATPVHAQYKLDIKTPTEEKYELQIIKRGVIRLVEESSWATEEEVGEDYSVWLYDFQRAHQGDSLHITLTVSLRTRAMLTRGRHINASRVWLSYHWDEVQQIAKDSLSAEAINVEDEVNVRQLVDLVQKMYGAVSLAAGSPTMGAEAAIVSAMAEPVIGEFATMLKREPSPVEVFESIYLAQQVLLAVEGMIKKQAGQ